MPKRIIYSVPVDVMSGSLSGPQELQYGAQGGEAYDIPPRTREGATNYEPRLVAMYSHKKQLRYFQVRTKHSVNMTDAMRLNLATMGGAGAIYSAIVSDKTSQLYDDCVHACPAGKTLRGWLVPILRPALAAKETDIVLADGLVLSNPWNAGTGTPVTISQTILDKFASELGVDVSPYNSAATAVLQNAFPSQWTTIRDYGFAHPALVPYINEDPMLVCSLMELGKIRKLICDGASGINTNLSATKYLGVEIQFQRKQQESYIDEVLFFGSAILSKDRFGLTIYDGVSNYVLQYNGTWNVRNNVVSALELRIHKFNVTQGVWSIDNSPRQSWTWTTEPNAYLFLFCYLGEATFSTAKVTYVKCYNNRDNNVLGYFVPFVSATRNGMLDIHDLEHPVFYPNIGTGAFGIEIADSQTA